MIVSLRGKITCQHYSNYSEILCQASNFTLRPSACIASITPSTQTSNVDAETEMRKSISRHRNFQGTQSKGTCPSSKATVAPPTKHVIFKRNALFKGYGSDSTASDLPAWVVPCIRPPLTKTWIISQLTARMSFEMQNCAELAASRLVFLSLVLTAFRPSDKAALNSALYASLIIRIKVDMIVLGSTIDSCQLHETKPSAANVHDFLNSHWSTRSSVFCSGCIWKQYRRDRIGYHL